MEVTATDTTTGTTCVVEVNDTDSVGALAERIADELFGSSVDSRTVSLQMRGGPELEGSARVGDTALQEGAELQAVCGLLAPHDYDSPDGLCLALSPCSTRLAVASCFSVEVYDTTKGTAVWCVENDAAQFFRVCFSPCGRWVALPSLCSVQLHHAETGEKVHTLRHASYANDVTFVEPHGSSHVAAGFFDASISLWSTDDGGHAQTLLGHTAPVNCIASTPCMLLSGSHDCSVRLWGADGRCLSVMQGHEDPVCHLAVGSVGAVSVVVSSSRSSVRVWQVPGGACLLVQGCGPLEHPCRVALSAAHNCFITSQEDSLPKFWDLETGCPVQMHHDTAGLCAGPVVVTPCGRWVFYAEEEVVKAAHLCPDSCGGAA